MPDKSDNPQTAPNVPDLQWSDWDAESMGFLCGPRVGLIVKDDMKDLSQGERWLSWEQTVALHRWLGEKIMEAKDG